MKGKVTCKIEGDKVILSDGRIFKTSEVYPVFLNGEIIGLKKGK